MFLPIGDEPNPRGKPVLTWVLIAVNVGIFLLVTLPLMAQSPDLGDPQSLAHLRSLARETGVPVRALARQLSAYDVFLFRHGFRPGDPAVDDLFFSMFLHGGWLHLLGNMLFLWIFGDNVEMHVGRLGYGAIYMLTGVAATLFFSLFHLDSSTPLVGASGAISGVLGCYFIWFPRNRVRVLMVLIVFVNVVTVPARWVLGFYIVAENLLPFLSGAGGGVAYGAHIGGFLGGLGVALAADRWRQRRSFPTQRPVVGGLPPVAAPTSAADGNAAKRRFELALGERRFHDALREYALMDLAARRSLDPEGVLVLADWLTENGRYEPALAVLQRFIATHPRSADLPRAHLRAGLIQLRGLRRPTAAYQHLLTVLDLDPQPAVADAARGALQEIESLRHRSRFR